MPRARRSRFTIYTTVHHPDTPEQMASPSSIHQPDPREQIASPDSASQPTSELSPPVSPPHEFEYQCSTEPGPSSSSNPRPRQLPFNWTPDQCFMLSNHMYENRNDFDDTVEWWGRIVPYLAGKTVLELRLFSYFYMRAYGELPHVPIKIPHKEEVTQFESDKSEALHCEICQQIKNPEKSSPPPPSIQNTLPSPEGLVLRDYFDWTLEECRKLLDLIKRKPSILRYGGAWIQLINHFPEKKVTDIGRHLAMVRLAVVFMGPLSPIPESQRLSYSVGQDAEVSSGDQQPSTSAQADDSQPSTSKPSSS